MKYGMWSRWVKCGQFRPRSIWMSLSRTSARCHHCVCRLFWYLAICQGILSTNYCAGLGSQYWFMDVGTSRLKDRVLSEKRTLLVRRGRALERSIERSLVSDSNRPAKSHGISVSLQNWSMIWGITEMLQNLKGFRQFDWSYIFLQNSMLLVWIREEFVVNPRNVDHRDLKLAPDGARTMIARWLRLHKQCIS